MTFDVDEKSADDSQPREFYYITVGDPVVSEYFVASGVRDLAIEAGGIFANYKATAVARTELLVAAAGKPAELTLSLPADHPLVTRWLLHGSPPGKTTLTARRLQVTSNEVEQIWAGKITSMNVDGAIAKFRCPSRASESMLRVIPTVTAGKECPHILYDSMCRLSRSGSTGGLTHKVSTTVISIVNGRAFTCDLLSTARTNDQWAVNGEVVHAASGERMTIANQTDQNPGVSTITQLTLQQVIPGLKAGDAIDVYAGCRKTIAYCHTNFNNRQNFGGFNSMPTRNVWSPVDDHGKGFVVSGFTGVLP